MSRVGHRVPHVLDRAQDRQRIRHQSLRTVLLPGTGNLGNSELIHDTQPVVKVGLEGRVLKPGT